MKLPFDEYELRARVFPALIVSIPVLFVIYAIAPTTGSPFGLAGIGTLLEAAALYLLQRIARDHGAKQQKRLFDMWGGPPTTRILRHDNDVMDALTKARIKEMLQATSGVRLPTDIEEKNNPAAADRAYGSAIEALKEQRRDGKVHRLVFNENCHYGFARNLYGIRWMGVTVALFCLAADGVMIYFRGLSSLRELSAGVSGMVILLLVFYITVGFVKRSAEAYAAALLRSCEPIKTKSATKRIQEERKR